MESNQGTIEDLLKLSNGAKNIYLFSFNVSKRINNITFPECDNPYVAIRTYKRNNNLLSSFVIIEGEYKYYGSTLKHRCETQTNIYEFSCDTNYYKLLQQWKDQCYIQGDRSFSVSEIRDNFGNASKILYTDLDTNVCKYLTITLSRDRMLNYNYLPNNSIEIIFFLPVFSNSVKLGDFTFDFYRKFPRKIDFTGYWSFTKPPQQPF